MARVEQAIVLAAGRGNQVDGIAKSLIRHPVTGKTILQHAIEAFAGKKVPARAKLGSAKRKPLEPAPGRYVKERAEIEK